MFVRFYYFDKIKSQTLLVKKLTNVNINNPGLPTTGGGECLTNVL